MTYTTSDVAPIEFSPHADTLLVQMDWVQQSVLDISNEPTLIPSGKVVAVGPGRLLDSGERIPPPFKVGDHVMIASESMCVLPICENPDDIVALVHEQHILGTMVGAVPGTVWFLSQRERDARRTAWDEEQREKRMDAAKEEARKDKA